MNKLFLRILIQTTVVAALFVVIFTPARSFGQCFASGDFDGSDPLTVADYVACIRFITGDGPAPANLYELDLNGDCMVDGLDAALFECYFTNGLSCFPVFPVPTCCSPDTTRGACCTGIALCQALNPQNCKNSYYHGDGTMCDANAGCPLLCGDVNGSGAVSISDVIAMIVCIFGCMPGDWMIAGDADCNGILTISDAVYLVNYIFSGGPAPCSNCN